MRFRFLLTVALSLVCVLFITSCITRHIETELTGTSWSLLSLQGQPLIEGTEITLAFTASYLEGTMGRLSYAVGKHKALLSLCGYHLK